MLTGEAVVGSINKVRNVEDENSRRVGRELAWDYFA